MFSKLKEKLKNWTQEIIKKKVVDEVEKKAKEEIKEKKKEEKVKKKLTKEKKKEEKEQKKKKEEKEAEKIQEEIKPVETHELIIPEKKEFDEEERKIGEQIIEDIKKEEEKAGFFKKVFSKITKIKISEEEFEEYSKELEMLLIENNVALEVAEKITEMLKEKIVGKEFLKKEIEAQIKFAFEDIIREILIEPFDLIEKIKLKKAENKPYVILFCGINGTGKTTTIAKIAKLLNAEKLSCVFAAADTFRAASIEQIKQHGEKLNVKVIAHEYGADPAAVGFDAIKYAEKNKINVVLIDTAGRMYTEKNLMAQISKIAKICKPDTKIFLGESVTGNDATEQARNFNETIGIDGIILSKADIDEKGGTALSVGYITKKPILFLGTGQEYDKLESFDKEKFIEKLGLNKGEEN
ncbi:MAG TPA: signal recognition particle-docking protein FtsY [Candidatus Pacearchaeota archaeon]|nr:signal recognition particle-docking protein FtsY [Candidatus Pacearchaeota archaeon]